MTSIELKFNYNNVDFFVTNEYNTMFYKLIDLSEILNLSIKVDNIIDHAVLFEKDTITLTQIEVIEMITKINTKKKETIENIDIRNKFIDFMYENISNKFKSLNEYKKIDVVEFQKESFNMVTEYDLQVKLIAFIRKNYPDTLISVSLALQDTELKRISSFNQGYISGTPDIVINELNDKYNGLAIELKAPVNINNVLSPKQNIQLSKYESRGFKSIVSNSYDELIILIYEYMKKRFIKCSVCNKKFNDIKLLNIHENIKH